MLMTARSLSGRGVPAANSPQMLDVNSYVSQAIPIRKCPEGCVKRCKAPQFRMAVKLAHHVSFLLCTAPASSELPSFLPIKNPLSCWNSEEQDRGDVPLPREVRGDNDMDTGDAFALLRYSDR